MFLAISNNKKFEQFCSIVKNTKELKGQVNFNFNSSGLYVQAMDEAHVSVLETSIHNSWFDNYNCTSESYITIGLDVEVLGKVLATKQEPQQLEMRYVDDSDEIDIMFTDINSNADVSTSSVDNITVAISDLNVCDEPKQKKKRTKKTYEKHFVLKLYDIEQDLMSLPFDQQDVEFTMLFGDFSTTIDQLMMFSDVVNVDINELAVSLIAENENMGTMSIKINTDDLEEISMDEQEAPTTSVLSNNYGLRYIKLFCNFNKISDIVEVKISNEKPIGLFFNIEGDGSGTNDTFLRLFIAPKITDNDD